MITTVTGPWTFTASGASGTFVVNAPVYDTAAIALYAVDQTTGTIYSPGYTAALAADLSGATLIVASGLTSGHTVVVYRVPKQTQAQRLSPSGPFPAPTVERQLDRAFADIQALRAITERSLRLPLFEAAIAELGAEVLRAGRVLGFDVDGMPALVSADFIGSEITVSAFMQTAVGKSSAAALLTYLGASPFGQTLLAVSDAAALRTAAALPYATATEALAASSGVKAVVPSALAGLWQTGTALASNATLDLTSGTPGFQRTISDASNAVTSIQGTQPVVRLTAGADGVTLTYHAANLISRTASSIVMRSGDSVTLLRIGTNQWREIDFEPVPNWRSGNLTIVNGTMLAGVPHYLGKRVGQVRLMGVNTTGDANFLPADFAAAGARIEFPRGHQNFGWGAIVDDVNVNLLISSNGLGIQSGPQSVGASTGITIADWTFWLEIDPRN